MARYEMWSARVRDDGTVSVLGTMAKSEAHAKVGEARNILWLFAPHELEVPRDVLNNRLANIAENLALYYAQASR